jgi:hypothetical protein
MKAHHVQPGSEKLHTMAVKWLADRANTEEEGGLGVFADTRFCTQLTKLLQRVERAEHRATMKDVATWLRKEANACLLANGANLMREIAKKLEDNTVKFSER